MRTIFIASAALVIGLTNAAMATPFDIKNNSTGSIGDEIGSPYDISTVAGNIGTAAGHRQAATLEFTVGANCNACTRTPSGSCWCPSLSAKWPKTSRYRGPGRQPDQRIRCISLRSLR